MRAASSGWTVREPVVREAAPKAPRVAARPVPKPPFATPDDAARYLAAAYNANDFAALKRITTPHAREHLKSMREWAFDLVFTSCAGQKDGTYYCSFRHSMKKDDGTLDTDGWAGTLVAPGRRTGWYASGEVDCG